MACTSISQISIRTRHLFLTSHILPTLKLVFELALEKKNSLLVFVKEEEENMGSDSDASC